ncbi:glycoside hydrolase family 31 protein [Halalkalibaculum sp. DA3122]|uniref:glycoside hydrolase family 31 protein n=1 Tax=Halalkalibaculum sp. DA3122 TaxID=3373607 RepID=UPI003754A6B1
MANKQIEDLQVAEDAPRYPDVATRLRPGTIVSVQQDEHTVTLTSDNNIELNITIVTPDILQLTYTTEGDTRSDFSYALDPRFDPPPGEYTLENQPDHIEISTSAVTCRVSKEQMLVRFYNAEEHLLCADNRGYYKRETLMKGTTEVSISQEAPAGARYFGLGDKAIKQNLRGRSYENWNTDAYGFERGDDPLYRSVPFYMALHDGRAYGIFLDNTYRSIFDFDSRKDRTLTFASEGGKMNYYFINGPELRSVAERYARLTGTPELPPLWGLGYHQCRWSYYPEKKVREIARTFRDLEIPCDAIYLDIDYMDEYKVFTWNRNYFPNPKQLIADLGEEGFQTIVMVDPGIRAEKGYEVYEDGRTNDVFCRRPDGELMIGPVWPPKTVFPDFTHPKVREWWGDLYDDFIKKLNISGIWNDMNEPAVFEVRRKTFPDDIRHHFDGHPCSHRKAHNIYGMQMARASLQGIKKHAPAKRPFLLTRANFAGGQRYAALWTGDNIASWDHLRLGHEQCLRLSVSGYSFCGTDIGGFVDRPSSELYTRWLQLGIFHPLFRTHSMGYHLEGAAAVNEEEVEEKKTKETLDQEPWSFGEKTTTIAREIIGLRYRLLSYLYTAFRQYVKNGTPILRPLAFHDQSDPHTLDAADEFMFGDQILVSPVLEKNRKTKRIYLPEGDWYHFWDDTRLAGRQKHDINTPLSNIPFFIKAGTVLPMRELMQYTGEKDPEKLGLLVYHGDQPAESPLYEDTGQGYGYKKGEYRHTIFRFESNSQGIRLSAGSEGAYNPLYNHIEVTFIGLPFKPGHCKADGKEVAPRAVKRHGKSAYTVILDPGFEKLQLFAE